MAIMLFSPCPLTQTIGLHTELCRTQVGNRCYLQRLFVAASARDLRCFGVSSPCALVVLAFATPVLGVELSLGTFARVVVLETGACDVYCLRS